MLESASTFALVVLASNLFWVGYAFLSVVVTLIIVRAAMPITYRWIREGTEATEEFCTRRPTKHFSVFDSVFLLLVALIFWPVVALAFILKAIGIVLGRLFSNGLRLAFKGVDTITPDIDIKIKRR